MRTRGQGFYSFPMASGGFNPNNDDVTLHKGSLSSPFTQKKMQIDIQTPQAGKKAGFLDILKNHRPASILKVSLSPSPVAYEIVSPYIRLKQVESKQSNVWEHIISLSIPLQGRSSTKKGLLGMIVLDTK